MMDVQADPEMAHATQRKLVRYFFINFWCKYVCVLVRTVYLFFRTYLFSTVYNFTYLLKK